MQRRAEETREGDIKDTMMEKAMLSLTSSKPQKKNSAGTSTQTSLLQGYMKCSINELTFATEHH